MITLRFKVIPAAENYEKHNNNEIFFLSSCQSWDLFEMILKKACWIELLYCAVKFIQNRDLCGFFPSASHKLRTPSSCDLCEIAFRAFNYANYFSFDVNLNRPVMISCSGCEIIRSIKFVVWRRAAMAERNFLRKLQQLTSWKENSSTIIKTVSICRTYLSTQLNLTNYSNNSHQDAPFGHLSINKLAREFSFSLRRRFAWSAFLSQRVETTILRPMMKNFPSRAHHSENNCCHV